MLNRLAAVIEDAIQRSPVVAAYTMETVQLSLNTGFVEGEITFIDDSRLAFFEFLQRLGATGKREKYRYHFMDANARLIFRYDDAPHHPALATYPHHKHLPTGLAESPAPDFVDVIVEAESFVLGIR